MSNSIDGTIFFLKLINSFDVINQIIDIDSYKNI